MKKGLNWTWIRYLSMSRLVKPDPVPPPKEWKRRKPWVISGMDILVAILKFWNLEARAGVR